MVYLCGVDTDKAKLANCFTFIDAVRIRYLASHSPSVSKEAALMR